MVKILGESGPAVLLIPGGAEAVEGFYPVLLEGLLEDPGCRILLVDRPGAGASTDEGGLAQAADFLHQAIAEAGAGPVVVIGQSLGGAVAVLLAAAHPDDVRGLVLLDPTPINDPELAKQIASRTASTVKVFHVPVVGGILRALLRATAKRSARKHAMTPELTAATLKITDLDIDQLGRSVIGIEEISQNLDLSTVPRVPAVVVTAERKPTDPIRKAHERLAESLHATLTTWPKAEHQVHLTHPAEVLATSRDVIGRAG